MSKCKTKNIKTAIRIKRDLMFTCLQDVFGIKLIGYCRSRFNDFRLPLGEQEIKEIRDGMKSEVVITFNFVDGMYEHRSLSCIVPSSTTVREAWYILIQQYEKEMEENKEYPRWFYYEGIEQNTPTNEIVFIYGT